MTWQRSTQMKITRMTASGADQAKSQINATLLTGTAANPATSSSTQRGQPQRPALSPVDQTLCRQAFGIF